MFSSFFSFPVMRESKIINCQLQIVKLTCLLQLFVTVTEFVTWNYCVYLVCGVTLRPFLFLWELFLAISVVTDEVDLKHCECYTANSESGQCGVICLNRTVLLFYSTWRVQETCGMEHMSRFCRARQNCVMFVSQSYSYFGFSVVSVL